MRLSLLACFSSWCATGALLFAACSLNEPRRASDPDASDAATDAEDRADAGDASSDAPPGDVEAGADAADAGPCDPVTGGGCGSGQKCGWIIDQIFPFVAGHTGCVPLVGSKALHDDCNSDTEDCAAGYHCTGECDKVCRSTNDCPARHICAPTNAFEDRPGVGLCFETCDPVKPFDCTEPGEACYWFGSVGTCFNEGPYVGECTSVGSFECARGTECVPINETTLECRRFCDPDVVTSCSSPQICRSFAQLFGAGYAETFGVCMPP